MWANNAGFQPFSQLPAPGPGYVIKFCLTICFIHNNDYPDSLDPIIGQGVRSMVGLDPKQPLESLTLPIFIIPRGGEYFFSASISGLTSTIAQT